MKVAGNISLIQTIAAPSNYNKPDEQPKTNHNIEEIFVSNKDLSNFETNPTHTKLLKSHKNTKCYIRHPSPKGISLVFNKYNT